MSLVDFGAYLMRIRKSKGVTLSELGINVGHTKAYLSKIEKGQRGMPSPELIRKISSALGVTHIGMMLAANHVTEEEVRLWSQLNSELI